MEHKYSTYVLFGIIGVSVMTVLVFGLDGYGTAQSIPKFIYGDVLGNSSLIDDANQTILTSTICTSTNGLCASNGSGTNTTTYINTTINNTYYINTTITNNITQNSTTGVKNFTVNEVGSTVTAQLCLLNATCFVQSWTDSTGGDAYNDSWIQPALDLKANITQVLGGGVLVEILNGSAGDGVLIEWMVTE